MNAPQQSTSAVPPMSATKRKFRPSYYRRGVHPRTMAQRANIETSFVRCKMMLIFSACEIFWERDICALVLER